MDQNDLTALKKWFAEYCGSFYTPVAEDQRNITLKQDHSHEVCLNALRIAKDLGLNGHETLLAETIALFHDVGRFSQYRLYKTFDDSSSVNHALLGAKALLEHRVLHDLPKREQDIIIHAVTLHNAFSLPEGLDDEDLLFTRLIRDADKLDILRVVIEYFIQDTADRAGAVVLGLPDLPGYSPDVLACLNREEMALKSMLTTQNDLKLLQLAWLYDLNFTSSLRIVLERAYIDRIAALLPENGEITDAVDRVRKYVTRKIQNNGLPESAGAVRWIE